MQQILMTLEKGETLPIADKLSVTIHLSDKRASKCSTRVIDYSTYNHIVKQKNMSYIELGLQSNDCNDH
jgi:hypothetical protein